MAGNATSDAQALGARAVAAHRTEAGGPVGLLPGAGALIGLTNELTNGLTAGLTPGSLEDRIFAATLACLGKWGTAKTTLDDIAREAGCSRATVYRVFPEGKDALFVAAGERELLEALHQLAQIAAGAASLEELLGDVLAAGVAGIRSHRVLQYLCEHEPGVILPYVSFDGLDPLLGLVRAVLTPHLTRFLDPAEADDVAEWLARVGITYGFDPIDGPDLADPAVARAFVRTFLLPGFPDAAPTRPVGSANPPDSTDPTDPTDHYQALEPARVPAGPEPHPMKETPCPSMP
jgi:AcrR family transcriptional regulator